MLNLALLSAVIVAATAGDIRVAQAMKGVGRVSFRRVARVVAVARRAARSRFLWAGILWKTIAFVSFLALLTRADLSWIVPATAATFVLETLAAKYWLREHISSTRWAGACCVALGVALILL